jgi:2-oxoglutarate ferredoxin oxidoreductase subunit delta
MAKGVVFFKEDFCKSCELCVSVCPQKILELNLEKINSNGYYPVIVTDAELCIACANCARICPEIAINIGKK